MNKDKVRDNQIMDKMFSLTMDRTFEEWIDVMFNPNHEPKMWCDNCDGFHKTEDCRELKS